MIIVWRRQTFFIVLGLTMLVLGSYFFLSSYKAKAQSYYGGSISGSVSVSGSSITVTGTGNGGTEVDDAWCVPVQHYATAPVRPTPLIGPYYTIDSGAGPGGSYPLTVADPGRQAVCSSPADYFRAIQYNSFSFTVNGLSSGNHRIDICVSDDGSGNPACDSHSFTISGPSPIGLTCSPASSSITTGQSLTFTQITVGVPAGGLSWSVSPAGASPSSASGTSSFATTFNSTGSYTVTVSDNAVPPDAPGTCNVTVTAAPDFSLSCSPPTNSIAAGSGTAVNATVTPSGGFSGVVNISYGASPSGGTPPIYSGPSPNSISSPYTTASTVALSTTVSTTQTTYTITFTGTSGALSHSQSCSVTVAPVSGNFSLSVTKTGTGGGTVSSNPAGISCGASCSASYAANTVVTLTATPDGTSTFAGFGGDADCSDGSVTMNVNVNCIATFNASGGATSSLGVTFAGTGSGSVTSSPPGINCTSTCSANFTNGTTITLTASPGGSSTFAGWSGGSGNGACSGTGTCVITINQASTITATFNANSTFVLSYLKKGAGTGTVYFSPPGTADNCSTSCNVTYATGTVVTMTAAAGSGSVFAGWGTDCSGTGSCVVTMSAAHSVQATFNVAASFVLTVTEAGTGSGLVTSNPSGISCDASKTGSVCAASFASGASVTLTPTPNANSAFSSWSGDCSGSGGCSVSMTKARAVTATFGPNCPAGTVNLALSTIDVTKTTTASAPAGFSGGTFVSGTPAVATVAGSTITGVEGGVSGGTSSITGTGWSYSNGATGCALSGSTITVRDFSISASASPASIQAGSFSNITVTVGPVNSGTMTVNVTAPGGLPAGWSITPASWSGPAGNQAVFVVSTTSAATQTTASLGFTGTYGVHSHNGSTNVTVTAPPPNPPTGVSLDNSSCGKIIVTWTAPVGGVTAPTGYNVYRSPNGSAPWTKIANNTPASPYNDTSPLAGLNYYYVTSVNGALESIAAYPSPAASTPVACVPVTTSSDKDIMQVNGINNLPGGSAPTPCNASTDLSSGLKHFVTGDVIRWQINFCNSGNAPVTSPSVTDTMTNMTPVSNNPATYTYSGCTYVSSSFSGTKQFTITVSDIPAGPPTKICSITFDAKIDSIGSAALSNFKNKVDFNMSGTLQSSYSAGPFLFNATLSNPTKKETP